MNDERQASWANNPLEHRMRELVDYSLQHVHGGGIPFAAFVMTPGGQIVGRGVNRVREHADPTAHAEVEAVRDACRNAGTPSLQGLTLLASGEPCAMCYLSALYAGVSEIVFAVDHDEAAAYGFDYRRTYALYQIDPRDWPALTVTRLRVPTGCEPFKAFNARAQ